MSTPNFITQKDFDLYVSDMTMPMLDEDAFAEIIIGEIVRNLLETEITQRDLDKISMSWKM